MLSVDGFRIIIIAVYIWFAAGAGIIGIFAAKELFLMIIKKKEDKGEVQMVNSESLLD